MKRLIVYSLVVASSAAVLNLFAADKALPTVSVAPTKPKNIAYWQPAMGEGLGQMMLTKLSALSNIKVIESLALEDLRNAFMATVRDAEFLGEIAKLNFDLEPMPGEELQAFIAKDRPAALIERARDISKRSGN